MDNGHVLRVGLVGCGHQGRVLARAARRTPAFEVVACADPDRVAAGALAAECANAPCYTSVEQLLESCYVDVVFVATPHHHLASTSLAAVRAGKHVMCETPMGLIEAEARQIQQAVRKAGVCFEVGYSFRYLSAWQRVHELVRTNTIGEVVAVTGLCVLPPLLHGWVAAPETGGGPLLFLGSHLIDQILWCMGQAPVEVFASLTRRPDTRADETTSLQMRFADGAVAQCLVSQTGLGLDYGMTIRGRAGWIRLQPVGCVEHEILIQSASVPGYTQPTSIRLPLTDEPDLVRQLAHLNAFADAICRQCEPAIGVTQGRKVLQVMDAAFRSSETGLPISL